MSRPCCWSCGVELWRGEIGRGGTDQCRHCRRADYFEAKSKALVERLGRCLARLAMLTEPAHCDQRMQWREVRHAVSLARQAAVKGDMNGAAQELYAASAEADDCRGLPDPIRVEIDSMWLTARGLRMAADATQRLEKETR